MTFHYDTTLETFIGLMIIVPQVYDSEAGIAISEARPAKARAREVIVEDKLGFLNRIDWSVRSRWRKRKSLQATNTKSSAEQMYAPT